MRNIADCIIPLILCAIFLYGLLHGVNIFDSFLEGAKEGISTSFGILPALVALMTCIAMFNASGALDILTNALRPICEAIGFPPETIPLALLRPISGSGALAIYENLLSNYGPDSFVGKVASVMQGSTETTFYTIAVYYGAVKVKKTRHTVPSALSADLTGFLMSVVAVRLLLL
ncbi:MAG TPA: spore maturation protein [Firmicutes bacterium]|nr:spore maturation protein [Bacillota bacterium]